MKKSCGKQAIKCLRQICKECSKYFKLHSHHQLYHHTLATMLFHFFNKARARWMLNIKSFSKFTLIFWKELIHKENYLFTWYYLCKYFWNYRKNIDRLIMFFGTSISYLENGSCIYMLYYSLVRYDYQYIHQCRENILSKNISVLLNCFDRNILLWIAFLALSFLCFSYNLLANDIGQNKSLSVLNFLLIFLLILIILLNFLFFNKVWMILKFSFSD